MQMKTLMMFFVLFTLAAAVTGCGSTYVADIAGDKISVAEFEQVYAKNNGGMEAAAKTSLEEKQKFLDLYVKFRLKVKDAYEHGYDKDPELKKELSDYRGNLAVSYMVDQEITKPALEKMYQRKLKEVRASHILIRVAPNASPEDTVKAFTAAQKIIDSLKMGIPFETLAVHNSQDPSVQQNKGDLYYFTAGAMVPEFEDAVFSMKAGEFSTTPIRTQFGYHVVKVMDVQQNQGQVHAAHIMKRLASNASAEDSAKAANELSAARDSIVNHNGDFGDFAKRLTDDTYSAPRGGDIGFIDRGRIVKEFDQALFALKDGDVSGVVKTQFGLHLIKRLGTKGVPAFGEIEQQLKTEYQRSRFQKDYNRMVEKSKAAYNFTMDENVLKEFAASVDTTKTTADAVWDSTVSSETRSKILFTFANEKVSVGTVISRAKENQELQNLSLKNPSSVQTIVKKIGDALVMEYQALQMQSKFPDFAQIMKEYEEGILLFKGEQENVWNKVAPSDSILRIYYEQNKAKYVWPDRVNVQEIYVKTDSIAHLVQKALTGYTVDSLVAKKTKRKTRKVQYDTLKIKVAPISFDSAAALFNKRGNTIAARGVMGLQPVSTNEITKQAWTWEEKDALTYVPRDGGFSFINVLQKDPAREKTFEEAQSEVSSAYQESETKRLSDAWVEELKKKYPVVINEEALKKAFTDVQPAAASQPGK